MTTEAVLPENTVKTIDEGKKDCQQPVHSVQGMLSCRLPTCNKVFTPDVHNKHFCCAEHQTRYWVLARRLGKVTLDEMQKDKENSIAGKENES